MWKLLPACLCPVKDSFRAGCIRRRAHLQGVGRGVTEPDIKQKLGHARGARRGRQERACGIEPCVGTNITCPPSPSSPLLSAHPRAPLHPYSPLLLFSLPLYSAALCPHCKLRAQMEKKSFACMFCSEVTDKNFTASLLPTGGVSLPHLGRLVALRVALN